MNLVSWKSLSRILGAVLGLAALVFTARSLAQPGEAMQLGSETDLQANFVRKFKTDIDFRGVQGTKTFTKDQLDLAAQWYVYRVTWISVQQADPEKGMLLVFKDFDILQNAIQTNAKTNAKFVQQFAPMLVQKFRDITNLDLKTNRTSVLNGIQMLPTLAQIKHDDIPKYLMELIKDPQKHEVIKLYALKAIREIFPISPITESQITDKEMPKLKEKELEKVDLLVGFINRSMPPGMDENAYRFLRREAIQSLAATRIPAVSAMKHVGKAEGPVAPTLLRTLVRGKNGLVPEATLHEKVEAAIGVMLFRQLHEYQPQAGIYLLGRFFEEYAGEYMKDRPNVILAPKDRKPPVVAWKVQSRRLENALSEMVKEMGRDNREAKDLETYVKPILAGINRYDNINLNELQSYLKKTEPKSRALFKTVKAPEVEWER